LIINHPHKARSYNLMKILIAGDWHSQIHEEPVYRSLKKLGHDPIRFPWNKYFGCGNLIERVCLPILKAQKKYMYGPIVNRLNSDLIRLVERKQPEIVFIYRGVLIFLQTLRSIKKVAPKTVLIGYNNDDPFSPHYPWWMWRHFLSGIPEYDIIFAYRKSNLLELKNAGAKRVELLRSWYIPEVNRPVELTKEEKRRYVCDIVFVGHYENDRRLNCLEQIVARNYNLRIYGHDYGWHAAMKQSPFLSKYVPLQTIWGEEYNKAINGARIALCFLSKLNRDTYTRRCFEITAARTLLLSEYTEDLASLFIEGKEADYFRSPEEMIKKIGYYLSNDSRRKSVAAAGYCRVREDGHDIVSRMEYVLEKTHEMMEHSIKETMVSDVST